MKTLTLEDCKKVKITDLWLGLPIFIATGKNHGYQKLTDEGVPNELASDFISALKHFWPATYALPMFLLILNNHYYNLSTSDEDPLEAVRMVHLEPLSDYYSKNEYRFVKIDGKVCLDVNSREPFKRYFQKALNNFDQMMDTGYVMLL